MALNNAKCILDKAQLDRNIQDLARQLAANEKQNGKYVLMGIHTRGVPLARRLAMHLGRNDVKIGTLDINLYRDDLSEVADMPVVKMTSIPFSINGERVLLVDDVLYTGRTVRSALDALMDLGRPKKIELLALIDRGGRELPIQADFCGKVCEVGSDEVVKVRFTETDGADEVLIAKL
jgi:pyrimidine operon attenuation protein / uracil phosphoribosyltransferase